MNLKYICYSLISATAVSAAALAVSAPQDMMPMPGLSLGASDFNDNPEEVPDSAMTDSLRMVLHQRHVDSFAIPAKNEYTALRNLRFEGADEDSFYPQVYKTYLANRLVLDSIPDETPASAAKAVLADIRPEILEGAFFYSGKNDATHLGDFARAYIDIPLLPAMADQELKTDARTLPTLAYIAASSAYNAQDFADAITYFDQYLATGDERQREQVYMFMGQACLKTEEYERGAKAMAEAAVLYPTNYHILTHGIQFCIDGKRADLLPFFLDRAILQNPDDEQLLLIQGQLLEDNQEFKKALDVFQRLDMIRPNNLSINKHLALCYFNLGVFYYNNAIMEQEEKLAKRSKRQSNSYFNEAAQRMEAILNSDPRAIKFLEAAAVCYGCTDNTQAFQDANTRLRALGRTPVKAMSMPSMIAFNEDNSTNFGSAGQTEGTTVGEVPSYNDYAAGFVSAGLTQWSARGRFEKIEAYNQRLSPDNISAEYERLCREAEADYIKEYGRQLRINDLSLGGYDPDNETYLITSSYGNITLPVPMKGKEAEMFASSWDMVNLRAPRFIIRDDHPAIAELTFVTPNGKSYSYSSADAKSYTFTEPVIDWGGIIDAQREKARENSIAQVSGAGQSSDVITFKSDVDENIPLVKRPNNNTVALIIANENYQFVPDVASAAHDGDVFAEYCEKTLGIPTSHIRKYNNASLGVMRRALSDVRGIVGSLNGSNDVNIIVYYAGHGMPDEATKDAFLLPVDGDAMISETCFSLQQFYKDLDEMNARNVMVFLDACFSGAQRGDGMLTQVRGVALKPKDAAPVGNMFVLSATTGQETAMPYKAKNHGMFTYFLLKKLQESKGSASLSEISDYVIKNVRSTSTAVNHKPQTPTVNASGPMAAKLSSIKLR